MAVTMFRGTNLAENITKLVGSPAIAVVFPFANAL